MAIADLTRTSLTYESALAAAVFVLIAVVPALLILGRAYTRLTPRQRRDVVALLKALRAPRQR